MQNVTAPRRLDDQSRHNTLGALLIGSWTNYMLFSLEIVLIWRYFVLFPRWKDDSLWTRLLVTFMLILDVGTTIDLSLLVYWRCVSTWGETSVFAIESEFVNFYVTLTAASIFTMQCFLIHRYLLLSRNVLLASWFILCSITAVISGALAVSKSTHYITPAEREAGTTYISIWLMTSFVTDLCIAAALAWEFSHVSTMQQPTKGLIRRLIRNAILCGSITACLAAAILVLFIVFPKDYQYSTMVASNMGRVCTLTVVYNLNFRSTGRDIIRTGDSSNAEALDIQIISRISRARSRQTVSEPRVFRSSRWSASSRPGIISEHDDADPRRNSQTIDHQALALATS